MRALVFPGQGSQKVGMGRALATAMPAARRVWEHSDSAVDFRLMAMAWEGPETALTATAHAQPALVACSIAALEALREESRGGCTFDVVAGHSLGEWSALVAAGVLPLADAIRLTHQRGAFMQQAVAAGEGAMAAILGMEASVVAELCGSVGEVWLANYNGAGQLVISGRAAAVDTAIERLKQAGCRRAVRLAVSAPFHCPLMAPARAKMADALQATAFSDAAVPVVCNVDAEPHTRGDALKERIIEQIVAPVRWEACVQTIARLGAGEVFELGAGNVLKGLIKRIDERLLCTSVGEPHEVAEVAAKLAATPASAS